MLDYLLTLRMKQPKTHSDAPGAARLLMSAPVPQRLTWSPLLCLISPTSHQNPGSIDGTVKLFHLGSKRVLQMFVHCKPEELVGGDIFREDAVAETLMNEDGEEILGEQKEVSIASVECISIAKGSLRWLASGGMDKTLKIWDTTNGTCRSICTHNGGVVSVKWHSFLPVVCTGCLDNNLRLWDARNGSLLAELTGHRDQVTFLDMISTTVPGMVSTPTDAAQGDALDTIISVSDDGTSRIFQISTAALLR